MEKQRALRNYFEEITWNSLNLVGEIEQFIIGTSQETSISPVESMICEILENTLDRFSESRAALKLMRGVTYGHAWRFPSRFGSTAEPEEDSSSSSSSNALTTSFTPYINEDYLNEVLRQSFARSIVETQHIGSNYHKSLSFLFK